MYLRIIKCTCSIYIVTDVNECESGTHLCSQLCLNNLGSYDCDCYTGYKRIGLTDCEGR